MSKVWTAEDVRKLQAIAQDVISLNTVISSPEDRKDYELGELIVDTSPGPEELAVISSTRDALLQIIETILSPREEKVIKLRYGFETGNHMTLAEVGKRFGVTRERIRQIEDKALSKIKKKFEKLNIKKGDI